MFLDSDPWACIPMAALKARHEYGDKSLSFDARCVCPVGQVLEGDKCVQDSSDPAGKVRFF